MGEIEEVPQSTGNEVQWKVDDYAVWEEIQKILRGIRQWTMWGDAEEVGRLREILTSLPGFPKMQLGDKICVRFLPKPTILIPRTYLARPSR